MLLVGHRGARNEAPENTLEGFEHIKKLGMHSMEFDLRLSKDHKIVIIHDETLDRTTNKKGKVYDFTAEELKAFAVPELKEVLGLFDHIEHAQLEVKSPKKEHHEIICKGIAACLKELNCEKNCVITSFDTDFLKSTENFVPHLRHGLIYQKGRVPRALSEKSANSLIDLAKELNAGLLAINYRNCTQFLIGLAKKNNIETSTWTVNEEANFLRLKEWGIDSIITDCPSRFLNQTN